MAGAIADLPIPQGGAVAATPVPNSNQTVTPQQADIENYTATSGAASRGLRSGFNSALGMVNALAGQTGATLGLTEFAQDRFKDAENYVAFSDAVGPAVRDISQVKDFNTLSQFVLGMGAQGLATSAPAIALALGLRRPVTGIIAGSLPQEAGEQVMNLRRDPTVMATKSDAQILGNSLVKGGVNSLIDATFGAERMAVNKVLKPTLAGGAAGMAKTVGKATVGEGLTEGAQNVVGQKLHQELNPSKELDWHEVLNDAAAGAAGGGAIGLGGAIAGAAPGAVSDIAKTAGELKTRIQERRAPPSSEDLPENMGGINSIDDMVEALRKGDETAEEFVKNVWERVKNHPRAKQFEGLMTDPDKRAAFEADVREAYNRSEVRPFVDKAMKKAGEGFATAKEALRKKAQAAYESDAFGEADKNLDLTGVAKKAKHTISEGVEWTQGFAKGLFGKDSQMSNRDKYFQELGKDILAGASKIEAPRTKEVSDFLVKNGYKEVTPGSWSPIKKFSEMRGKADEEIHKKLVEVMGEKYKSGAKPEQLLGMSKLIRSMAEDPAAVRQGGIDHTLQSIIGPRFQEVLNFAMDAVKWHGESGTSAKKVVAEAFNKKKGDDGYKLSKLEDIVRTYARKEYQADPEKMDVLQSEMTPQLLDFMNNEGKNAEPGRFQKAMREVFGDDTNTVMDQINELHEPRKDVSPGVQDRAKNTRHDEEDTEDTPKERTSPYADPRLGRPMRIGTPEELQAASKIAEDIKRDYGAKDIRVSLVKVNDNDEDLNYTIEVDASDQAGLDVAAWARSKEQHHKSGLNNGVITVYKHRTVPRQDQLDGDAPMPKVDESAISIPNLTAEMIRSEHGNPRGGDPVKYMADMFAKGIASLFSSQLFVGIKTEIPTDAKGTMVFPDSMVVGYLNGEPYTYGQIKVHKLTRKELRGVTDGDIKREMENIRSERNKFGQSALNDDELKDRATKAAVQKSQDAAHDALYTDPGMEIEREEATEQMMNHPETMASQERQGIRYYDEDTRRGIAEVLKPGRIRTDKKDSVKMEEGLRPGQQHGGVSTTKGGAPSTEREPTKEKTTPGLANREPLIKVLPKAWAENKDLVKRVHAYAKAHPQLELPVTTTSAVGLSKWEAALNQKERELLAEGVLRGALEYKESKSDLQPGTAGKDFFEREAARVKEDGPKFGKNERTRDPKDLKKFSSQDIARGDVDPALQQEVENYIRRVLGDKVDLKFIAMEKAGSFAGLEGVEVIRIAVDAIDPRSVGYHEAVHALVARLLKHDRKSANILLRAASSPGIVARLNELLKHHPKALEQIKNDPEERVAYMYQFWAAMGKDARLLNIGPETRGVFELIKKFFRSAMAIFSDDMTTAMDVEDAGTILDAFHNGAFAEPNAVHEVLRERGLTNKARDRVDHMWPGLGRFVDKFVWTAAGAVRDMKYASLTKIMDKFHTTPGAEGKEPGFLQEKAVKANYFGNRVIAALKGLNETQQQALLEEMRSGKPRTSRAAKELEVILKDLHKYLVDSGVKTFARDENGDIKYNKTGPVYEDLGNIERYFPRVSDPEYTRAHKREFIDLLTKYGIPKPEQVYYAYSMDPNMSRPPEEEILIGLTYFTPQINKRTLAAIPDAELAPFLNKDLFGTLMQYSVRAARRAEYTKRFGNVGEKIREAKEQALAEGMTHAQALTFDEAVQAMEGSLGANMSDELKAVFGGLMTYQNIRLLPLALFSSLIDPGGIAIRGGTMGEATQGFMRGIRELFGDKHDAAAQLAEAIGVISAAGDAAILSDMYGSQYMPKIQQYLNDQFFKYNGMESWNRSMRIVATGSAIEFIKRHIERPNEHSARYLRELNLSRDDVKIEKGKINIDNEKVRQAITMWVDQAILRPNAAMRPIYMSDPHWMLVSHLKQYMYLFQKTIISRVANELNHGNYSPAFTLAGYVPMIIAADMLRVMLTPGSGDDDARKNWGAEDWLWRGVQRAGIFGPGQMVLDAGQDVTFGRTGLESAMGPTLQQMADFARAGTTGNFDRELLNAVPGARLFR